MYSNLIKKLIVLLSYNNKNNPAVMKFRNQVVHGQIPEELISYLYNYLYRSDNSLVLDLKYENGKIIIEESSTFNGKQKHKYSIIEMNKGFGDVKRTTALAYSTESKGVLVRKQVHYALSSGLDLIILETKTNEGSYSSDLGALARSTIEYSDYNKICFLSTKDPSYRVYKMHESTEDGIKESLVYLDNDILRPCDGKKTIPSKNMTEDAKNTIMNLKELYSDEEEMIMNSDKQLSSFFEKSDIDLSSYFDNIKPL